MKKNYGSPTNGLAHKNASDDIMLATWDNDIQSRVAYLYDYFHDDEPLKFVNLHPEKSKTKIAVDIKFIINAYNSESKDQVGYHIQFKPRTGCVVDYYDEVLGEEKFEAEYPIGLYCDIPDDEGVYRKWLITDRGYDLNPQFPTYYVLPCDYIFQWVYGGKMYSMAGVSRSQNSYNSGIWTDYRITTIENQRKCVLPMNDISTTIFYDQRLAISAPIAEPIVWKCSKVEQTSPKGVSRLTFVQDHWDQHHDYIQHLIPDDPDSKVIGIWCNYFDYDIIPEDSLVPKHIPYIHSEITYAGNKPEMKINGNNKTFTVTFYDKDTQIPHKDGVWSILLDGVDIISDPTRADVSQATDKLKFKFIGTRNDIGKIITVGYSSNDGVKSQVELELRSL
jgi:hypothetical protein